jgi:hypothetical protein
VLDVELRAALEEWSNGLRYLGFEASFKIEKYSNGEALAAYKDFLTLCPCLPACLDF